MSEPTLAKSFKDLIIKVAKEAGVAYYGASGALPPMPPVDYHDLYEIKEIINDGIRMFMADAPATGWRWRRRIASITLCGTRITGTADAADSTSITDLTLADTYDADDDLNGYYIYILTGTGLGSWAVITDYTALTGKITVADWLDQYGNAAGTDPEEDSTFAITSVETVGGDNSRYPLPEYYSGEVTGKIEYAADSSLSGHIEWRDESFIRARQAVSTNSGNPLYAALRPLEPLAGGSLGPKRRIELIVEPAPSSDVTLEFPYDVTFDKLDAEAGEGDSGGATTIVDATRLEGDDYFNGWKISIIGGTGKGSWAIVTDYTGSSGTFTVADWLTAAGAAGGTNPTTDSIYYVEPLNNLHPAGHRFDEVVISASFSKAEQSYPDAVDGNYVEEYHQKAIVQAYKIDARLTPRTLGTMNRRRINVTRIRNSNTVEFN